MFSTTVYKYWNDEMMKMKKKFLVNDTERISGGGADTKRSDKGQF